jgi:hypothetical protein
MEAGQPRPSTRRFRWHRPEQAIDEAVALIKQILAE